jgi:HD-GYP domain-containing protein (c-di-GMP phosphodiesterase class II)
MNIGKELFNKKISLDNIGLYNKTVLSFFFMFVIPILLTSYLVFFAPRIITDKDKLLAHSRIIIIWMTVVGIFGYLLMRRVIKRLIMIIKQVESLSSTDKDGKIDAVRNDELKHLSEYFNKIKAVLESKVKELQYSRSLTRELFQRMGHAMTSNEKLDALLNIIVHGMKKVLDARSSFVALYGSDGKLHLKAYAGGQGGLSDNMVLSDIKGVIGQVIKSSNPVVAKKNATDPSEDLIHYGTNIACVPILIKGKMGGVLVATDKRDTQTIDPEDVFLLENVAGQIAICVENLELSKNIEETYYNTLIMLARIVEARDPYSAGHLERVSSYVQMLADRIGVDEETKKILMDGALLHDLGKVGIEDTILKKKGALTPQEYETMKQHAIIGENILKPLRSMSKLSTLVRHHHELCDGSGYPDKLKGEEISLAARILTIVDIYDASTTNRPYRNAMSQEEAIKMIRSYAADNKLDPKLVEVFIQLITENKKT